MTDYVILVDENDNPISTAEKLAAHQSGGKLHRAFSVFVFNDA
jgi:isopentenyl-diphosphate delta-isomerase